MKRIRLTIEWDGPCSEKDWSAMLAQKIENVDLSGASHVTKIELLTHKGTTSLKAIGIFKRARYWFRLRSVDARSRSAGAFITHV